MRRIRLPVALNLIFCSVYKRERSNERKSKASDRSVRPTLLLLFQQEIGCRQHDHVHGAADQRQVRVPASLEECCKNQYEP